MVFSTNQVRQLYVITAIGDPNAASAKVGTMQFKRDQEGNMFGTYLGAGGITRTDLIKSTNIRYAKASSFKQLRRGLQKWEVSLSPDVNGGDILPKREYLLRITIREFGSMSPESYINKYGSVYGRTGMSTSDFYKQMVASLKNAFSDRDIQYFKFSLDNDAAPTKIIIEEVKQPWVLGTKSSDPIYAQIESDVVVDDEGEHLQWGDTKVVKPTSFVNNGENIADLEYFTMGERGDVYRNVGWPHVIKTQYLVDPSKQYNVIDIHHYFADEGVFCEASEKDMTFVIPAEGDTDAAKIALANQVITAFNAASGITIDALR